MSEYLHVIYSYTDDDEDEEEDSDDCRPNVNQDSLMTHTHIRDSQTWIKINLTMTSHEYYGVSAHRQLNRLFNDLFGVTSKQISKLRFSHVTGLLWGES